MDVVATTITCVLVGLLSFSLWHGMRNVKSASKINKKMLDDHGYETGIDTILYILEKNGVVEEHRSLIHSMIILLSAKENCNLGDLFTRDNHDMIHFGRQYILRFATNPSNIDCFLAGVIEQEFEHIRLGTTVPLRDVHEIRKIIDAFYYRNLK